MCLKNLFAFLGKANSEENGSPSSRRVIVMYAAFLFATVLAIGFVFCLLYYKDFITSYRDALLLFMAAALGIGVWAKKGETKVEPPEAPKT